MIKQYVNLPNNSADHHGASINLVVNADDLAEEGVAYTEWWVEATGADNVDRKYLSTTKRARMRYATRHHSGTRFRNTFLLPHVGGDKYQVKCSKRGDRSAPTELEEIETWRKIYYTVHWMNNNCRDTFNAVKGRFKAAFEESFIELEEAASNQTRVDEANTRSTNALTHLYRRRPALTNKPWHLRIVVLNDIYDIEESEHNAEDFAAATGSWETGKPLSDETATHWLISAKARVHGGGSWISIRRMVQKDDDTHFSFDVSGNRTLNNAINGGGSIDIKVRTRERDHYLGHSIGNFVCVRTNETGTAAEIEQTILQTFTHEVGHGFQQVVRRERTHNAAGNATGWENNTDWHTDDYGGQGPHCRHDATEVDAPVDANNNPTTDSGRTFITNGSTLCTMFFRDDDDVDADGKFCASCLPRLKRVNLSRAKMRGQGWNDY
jgi:hypothetical protein